MYVRDLFLGHRSLIKNKTRTVVINIVSFRIFMNLTFRMLVNIHFQKWSKVTVTDYDETIDTKIYKGSGNEIKNLNLKNINLISKQFFNTALFKSFALKKEGGGVHLSFALARGGGGLKILRVEP